MGHFFQSWYLPVRKEQSGHEQYQQFRRTIFLSPKSLGRQPDIKLEQYSFATTRLSHERTGFLHIAAPIRLSGI